jgi:arsenate reductase
MKATIYHNPQCSNSRAALAILRERGVETDVIEYLKMPPTRDQLAGLLAKMGMPARDILRWKEKLAENLKQDAPEGELLDALAAHPVLMNRPIVVTQKGAKLCRPGETVLELL